MKHKFCCKELEYYTTVNKLKFEHKGKIIYYSEKFEEFGIMIKYGGESYITIKYCPWSGDKLPESKRTKWFDELEKLGFDDPLGDPDSIPEIFNSGEWINRDKS